MPARLNINAAYAQRYVAGRCGEAVKRVYSLTHGMVVWLARGSPLHMPVCKARIGNCQAETDIVGSCRLQWFACYVITGLRGCCLLSEKESPNRC